MPRFHRNGACSSPAWEFPPQAACDRLSGASQGSDESMRKILLLAPLLALAAAPPPAQHPERSSARQGELILHQMTNYNGDYYTIDFDRTSVETEWNIRSIS